MKEDLKKWLRANAKEVVLVIGMIGFLIGAIFFGKTVWNVGYETVWGRWLALIIGEMVYLYIFTFLIFGVTIFLMREVGWFGEFFLVLMCIFILTLFFGIILKSINLIRKSAIFFIIIGVIIFIAVRKQHR